jgi:hypothetical protein
MSALLSLILIPAALMLVALLGYFFGVILSVTPLIGTILTVEGVDTPTVLAWVFVAAFMLALMTGAGKGDSK